MLCRFVKILTVLMDKHTALCAGSSGIMPSSILSAAGRKGLTDCIPDVLLDAGNTNAT